MTAGPVIKRPIAASVARWALAVAAGAVIALVIAYHRHIWQAIAPVMAGGVALVWGVAQKLWAARDKWIAYWTTPGAGHAPPAPPNHPQAAKAVVSPRETTMDLKTLLAETLAAVQAALPDDYKEGIAKTLDDGLTVAQSVADSEIAAAEAKLPPALAPFAPQIGALADNAIAAAQAKAEAEVNQWAAVKAAVAS